MLIKNIFSFILFYLFISVNCTLICTIVRQTQFRFFNNPGKLSKMAMHQQNNVPTSEGLLLF